jgi:hypothetical protein
MSLKSTNLDKESCSREENVSFIDQFPGPLVSMKTQRDATAGQGSHTTADLGAFLARPVKIYETSVAPGSVLNDSINPWHAWATNAFVKKKLDNFSLFNGNLMVKAVINGTPFHYGKFMLSYRPLHNLDQISEDAVTDASSNTFIQAMVARSQRPNLHLDPSTNTGGCLCLPFLWTVNALSIPQAQEWIDLGELKLDSLMPLSVTSATTSNVTISLFAFCPDAEVTVPTYSPAAEAGDEYDPDYPVSSVANVVAAAAGTLSAIPIIRPFALAAEMAGSAVAGIASLFGFSKPNNIEPVGDIRRNPGGDIAVTNSQDSVSKLTLDGKQGVTVDPRVTGVGDSDEMTIQSIATRDSYVTYFEWQTTDAVDVDLFWSGVTPMLTKNVTSVAQTSFQPTALAFCAMPFQYWAGTLVFRFEIMASRYHKGRLKISWDPFSLTNAQVDDNYNTNYMQIIDLEESRNIEFSVSWGRAEPYLTVPPKTDFYYLDPNDGSGSFAGDFFNGFINVSVLNELVAPVTDANVRINVYARAGDDFEVQGPYDGNIQAISYFPYPESGEMYNPDVDAENLPEEAAVSQELDPGHVVNPMDLKSKVFFGERIVSFRNLVKRYNLHGVLTNLYNSPNPNSDGMLLLKFFRPDFPEYRGVDPNALFKYDAFPDPFTPSYTTILNYLTPAYVCRRGGMRNMYLPAGDTTPTSSGNGGLISLRVARCPDDLIATNAPIDAVSASGSTASTKTISNVISQEFGPYFVGAWTTRPQQQKVAKIETPFYTPSRFVPARYLDMMRGQGGKGNFMRRLHHVVEGLLPMYSDGTRDAAVRVGGSLIRWVAAADDFSLSFYLNAPKMYSYVDEYPDVRPLT